MTLGGGERHIVWWKERGARHRNELETQPAFLPAARYTSCLYFSRPRLRNWSVSVTRSPGLASVHIPGPLRPPRRLLPSSLPFRPGQMDTPFARQDSPNRAPAKFVRPSRSLGSFAVGSSPSFHHEWRPPLPKTPDTRPFKDLTNSTLVNSPAAGKGKSKKAAALNPDGPRRPGMVPLDDGYTSMEEVRALLFRCNLLLLLTCSQLDARSLRVSRNTRRHAGITPGASPYRRINNDSRRSSHL
jgi:hypothetical protein